MELEEEADVCREQRDLLVDVDEAAAVHDAEAAEDGHGHQHEHDQEQGAQAQQGLQRTKNGKYQYVTHYKVIQL